MQYRALPFRKTETDTMLLSHLETAAQGWFLSGEIVQHSPATLARRHLMVSKLIWFLKQRELPGCSPMELQQFFTYLSDKKPIAGGCWGDPHESHLVKPSTVATSHATLRAL